MTIGFRPSVTGRSFAVQKEEEKQVLSEPDNEIAANSSSAGLEEKTDSEDRA